MLTTPEYWDCECEYHYIHPVQEDHCYICGAQRYEQPSSRINEVMAAGLLLLGFPKED